MKLTRQLGYDRRYIILRSTISVILLKIFIRLRMENPSMLKYKVVLVPFPFDDLSSTKVRPAVCLTRAIGLHNHVVLAFITSRIPQAFFLVIWLLILMILILLQRDCM